MRRQGRSLLLGRSRATTVRIANVRVTTDGPRVRVSAEVEGSPLWSSSRIEIVHSGAGLWRNEKLQLIAGEDLVRRHLRVCWENRSYKGNCGHCEKCVRTMLVLAQAHQLEHFPVFAGTAPVLERIHQLPRIAPALFPDYEELLRQCNDSSFAEALRALLARSRTVPSHSVGRALAHRLLERVPRRRRYGGRHVPASW